MSDTHLQVCLALAGVAGIVFALTFLGAMFRREAVKRDLCERGCRPLHIRWRPWAFWAPLYHSTPFRVVYVDPHDRVHKACCYVDNDLGGSPLGPRRVQWIQDELKDFIDV